MYISEIGNERNNEWVGKKPQVKCYRKLTEGSLFFKFVVNVIRLFIKIKCVRFSEGEENIPETGAAIVIAPHLGSIDAVLATEFVTRCGRMPRIMAKKGLWKIPVVKQAFNSGKLIPVERNSSNGQNALIGAKKALDEGDLVFIFPEGTYTKDPDYWPMTCKTGAARLTLMTGAPVYPVLQDGEQFMIKGEDLRTGLPWYKRYHFTNKFGKERVLVHLKGYPSIDFVDKLNRIGISNVWDGKPVANPTDEQIKEVNAIIEGTLTEIVEESRDFKAPQRWNAKNGKRE